jgi:putative Holliday junction resolvase
MKSTSSEAGAAPKLPKRGPLLGIDHGTRRLGLAISDAGQTIAMPLLVYHRGTALQDGRYLIDLAKEFGIVGIVVGLPTHMSGDEGQRAREAREYGQWAARMTQLPVDYVDERFTTAMAEELLSRAGLSAKKRRAQRDRVAAQCILQAYLEGGRGAQCLTDG